MFLSLITRVLVKDFLQFSRDFLYTELPCLPHGMCGHSVYTDLQFASNAYRARHAKMLKTMSGLVNEKN